MLKEIYNYELKYWFKNPSTYIYIAVFFSMAFFTMLGTGGYFDGVVEGKENVIFINSPFEINYIIQYFNKFFLFLIPAIIGATIYKDYKHRAHNIMYSFPIQKSAYLWGKFLSALTIVLVIVSTVAIALLLGEIILGIDNPKIGEMSLKGYAITFLFFVWPNMFIFGLLVFMVVTASRSVYAGFIVIILLFLIEILIKNLFTGSPFLIALFDPFGQSAVMYETNYWNLTEKNNLQIPIWGVLLYNRLLWFFLSIVGFVWFYKKFSFTQESNFTLPTWFKSKADTKAVQNSILKQKVDLSGSHFDYSWKAQMKAMFALSNIDFKFIVKSWMFLLLVGFGILALVFSIGKVTNTGEFNLQPLTAIILSIPTLFFTIIITLITFLFSGLLVHRSRVAHTNLLIDSTAISNWVLMGSKIIALVKVQMLLLFVMMLSGVLVQLFNGYYEFEFGLYLYHLYLVLFPSLLAWAIMSVLIHTIFANQYIGIFVLLLGWIGKDQLNHVGINSYLISFSSPPQLQYFDMNGYGTELLGNQLVNAYWLAFSGILAVLVHLFWVRGLSFSFKERLGMAKRRFGPIAAISLFAFLIPFVAFGYKIYKEECIALNKGDDRGVLENFKANFAVFKDCPQPKITDVNLSIDLFPESNSFTASGHYTLVNKTNGMIDTLLIKTGFDERTAVDISVPSSLVKMDKKMQFSVHALDAPIAPNDSLTLHFEVENNSNTFFERNSGVLKNGTFMKNDILPRLGYFLNNEAAEPSDSLASTRSYYSIDADHINLETIISTHPDQIAIAPGYLQREWEENSRKYYHYKSGEKIKLAFAFNSGVFSTLKENYKGIDFEIFHHKKHDQNIGKMMDGLKNAIDYNTKYFSPYPYKNARIIEFPRSEGTFATVMANSISMSEVRFVTNHVEDVEKVDLSFYVAVHELTHVWFGNQLIPANADGAKMLTESITEYISLQIYRKYYSEEKAFNFLQLQRKRYLEGRARDNKDEVALQFVKPNQMYIDYGKGTMAFNMLSHYLGEDNFNAILKEFFNLYRNRTDQYPTSIELVQHLKNNLPATHQYLIEDWFETITFYENKIKNSTLNPLANGAFQAKVDFEVYKYRNEEKSVALPLNDFIELGFYNSAGELFHTELVNVTTRENEIEVMLKEEPVEVILDPNLLTIDLDVDDNQSSF